MSFFQLNFVASEIKLTYFELGNAHLVPTLDYAIFLRNYLISLKMKTSFFKKSAFWIEKCPLGRKKCLFALKNCPFEKITHLAPKP